MEEHKTPIPPDVGLDCPRARSASASLTCRNSPGPLPAGGRAERRHRPSLSDRRYHLPGARHPGAAPPFANATAASKRLARRFSRLLGPTRVRPTAWRKSASLAARHPRERLSLRLMSITERASTPASDRTRSGSEPRPARCVACGESRAHRAVKSRVTRRERSGSLCRRVRVRRTIGVEPTEWHQEGRPRRRLNLRRWIQRRAFA